MANTQCDIHVPFLRLVKSQMPVKEKKEWEKCTMTLIYCEAMSLFSYMYM